MPRRLRRAPSPATPAPVVQATATEFRRAHCPVCGHQVGRLRVTVPGKPHLVVEMHNPWEAPRPGVDGQRPFGIILQSSGNAGIQVMGYFEPDDDPDGFFPLVKARMIEAVQDWRSKGYLTLDDFGPEPEAVTPITPEPRVPPGAPLPPSEVVHVPPARPRARPARPAPPPAPAPTPTMAIPAFDLPEEPGRRSAQALIHHLEALEKLAELEGAEGEGELEEEEGELEEEEEEVGLAGEYKRLMAAAEKWQDAAQQEADAEENEDRPSATKLERLQEHAEVLNELVESFRAQNPSDAMDALERAYPAPAPRRRKEPPVEQLEKAVRAFVPRIDALKKAAKPTQAALDRVMTALTNLRDRVADQVETSTGDRRNRLQALLLRLDQAFPAVREAEAALERQNLTAWSKALDRLRECCTEP